MPGLEGWPGDRLAPTHAFTGIKASRKKTQKTKGAVCAGGELTPSPWQRGDIRSRAGVAAIAYNRHEAMGQGCCHHPRHTAGRVGWPAAMARGQTAPPESPSMETTTAGTKESVWPCGTTWTQETPEGKVQWPLPAKASLALQNFPIAVPTAMLAPNVPQCLGARLINQLRPASFLQRGFQSPR